MSLPVAKRTEAQHIDGLRQLLDEASPGRRRHGGSGAEA